MFTIIHTVTISSIQSIAFTDRGTGSLPYLLRLRRFLGQVQQLIIDTIYSAFINKYVLIVQHPNLNVLAFNIV